MNTWVINTIQFLVGRLIDADLHAEIINLVEAATELELPGEEKRARVLAALHSLGGKLGPIVAATAGFLLNLALEVAVAQLKAKTI